MSHRAKIRRDDLVKVIAGKDKGKTGKVLRVDIKKEKVYVEGLNIQTRHKKAMMLRDTQRQQAAEGGVIKSEGPIHISNVMLLDPKTGDPTRVGIKREGGRRVRIAKRSGQEVD
jgi:large subunit ribosomal protein L24